MPESLSEMQPANPPELIERVKHLETGHKDLSLQLKDVGGTVNNIQKQVEMNQVQTSQHLLSQDTTIATLKELVQGSAVQMNGILKALNGDPADDKPGIWGMIRGVDSWIKEKKEEEKDHKKRSGDFKIGLYLTIVGAALTIVGSITVAAICVYLKLKQ